MRSDICIDRRRFVVATLAVAAATLAGCKSGRGPVAIQCAPPEPVPVNRRFLFDRTTVPPADLAPRLVRHLQQTLKPRDHLQVLVCGGVTPALVQESARFQLPADAQPDARDRWSKSPEELRRRSYCTKQALEALNLKIRLAEIVNDTDAAVQARSPLFEAIAAGTQGWKGDSLDVWADGLEHLGAERSFYGRDGSLKLPEPGAWVERLKAEQLVPDLKGVRVTHLAIGLSEAGSAPRVLRSHAQTVALKQLWSTYWEASGAEYRFGEPLPV